MVGFLDMFRQKSPAEQLRDNKRMIDRAIRDLDRERETCKMMAKDVVRTRAYITNCFKMRAQMSSTMKSQQAMAMAMHNVTRTMRTMNKQMNLPAMQKIMAEFERQGDIADMKQEMMEDAMEDAMGADNEEADTDALVSQIFDEVGISFAHELTPTPNHGLVQEDVNDADLKARLESLRRA